MRNLISQIIDDTSQTYQWTGINHLDDRVLEAIGEVPRERYVPKEYVNYAKQNVPLGIGYGQTISQPFIVALMTELLQPRPDHVVLEVGCGSGYQASILSLLVDQVYSVEIVPQLAEMASSRLSELGYHNVQVKRGDGWYGWLEHGPYDGILVAAVTEHIPPQLIEQLRPGGRLVIPVGEKQGDQQLVVATKTDRGLEKRQVLPVRFVPFTRAENPN